MTIKQARANDTAATMTGFADGAVEPGRGEPWLSAVRHPLGRGAGLSQGRWGKSYALRGS